MGASSLAFRAFRGVGVECGKKETPSLQWEASSDLERNNKWEKPIVFNTLNIEDTLRYDTIP